MEILSVGKDLSIRRDLVFMRFDNLKPEFGVTASYAASSPCRIPVAPPTGLAQSKNVPLAANGLLIELEWPVLKLRIFRLGGATNPMPVREP